METIMSFVTPILLWMVALIINTGKANFLIAGYNTATQEEKDKTDEKALSKFMGKFLFVLGLIQLIIPVSRLLGFENFRSILVCVNILFIVTIICGVIYANTNKRFEK
ncbi:DUF3784 domain-containing protein [Clostridium swellfunianum]|uniref:DUF3784 domain-containing protein n=1 Tax=Clostridium swellfunianum TaxID=1367462 RepID=UPI00202F9C2A|nr:DUF3784 domain-containing protein [Clostridium swellfunianum]MCM0650174.1 DUF3784 domain-containing protein [Clostridium swellfunianum]